MQQQQQTQELETCHLKREADLHNHQLTMAWAFWTDFCIGWWSTAVKAIIVAVNIVGFIVTIAISNKGIRNSIANYISNTRTICAVISVDAWSTAVSSIIATLNNICIIIAIAITDKACLITIYKRYQISWEIAIKSHYGEVF